ncbi:hypothetical protein DFQ00_1642 [Paenibacillus barcinonensis]|uniref:Uncharacterized protein n=1 Tax=Paenibacillus barcinonensis TaxID=198119 RepID=A0A2V4VRW5_PAEBA|nr:hypothetical protein DFQ00_1642 [Paenibacillus barcinonensis]
MPRIAKSFLLIMVVIGLLGGCSGVNKEDQEIIDRSESIAIKYLKETYDLDVTITERRMLPKMAMSRVTVYGYVTGNPEQNFTVSINYETGKSERFSFSSELESFIESKGLNPFNQK